MRKNIIILVILFLFYSCMSAVPIMNNSVPMKENQERVVLSGGLGKLYIQDDNSYSLLVTSNGKSAIAPIVYGSFKRQLDDIFSLELFTFGIRLTEDIYKDKDLYISCFQSVHLLGGNTGMIFASLNQEINKYVSFGIEYNIVQMPAEGGGTGEYFNLTPSLGLNFKQGKHINFIELVASIPVYTKSKRRAGVMEEGFGDITYASDSMFTDLNISLQYGVSF